MRAIRLPALSIIKRSEFFLFVLAKWSSSWQNTDQQLRWMNDDLIYHEDCAIALDTDKIKICDAPALVT